MSTSSEDSVGATPSPREPTGRQVRVAQRVDPSPKGPPSRRAFRGPRFLLIFFVGMILVLVLGIWMTWTLGSMMAPALRAKRLQQIKKEQAERDRERARENKTPALH